MFRPDVLRAMVLGLLLGLGSVLSEPVLAQAQDEPDGPATSQGAGVVQELDLAARKLVIDGRRYDIAADVQVEIDGSYGAFTMLEEGMRVYFEYRYESSTSRLITAIRELPDDVVLEQT